MRFKFLMSLHREGAEAMGSWAKAGDPVVPNFPVGAENTFLGAFDFKPVPYARVAELPKHISLDSIADSLKRQFPGLPPEFLDTYVLETAKLAFKLPIGSMCQIYVDTETAKVRVLDSDECYVMWEKQPIPERYK